MAPLSHRGSSRVTAISNVIPAISTWPKRAMVNSICSLVSICLIPQQWTRCSEWQRSVNESLPVGYVAPCEALSVAMGSVFEERATEQVPNDAVLANRIKRLQYDKQRLVAVRVKQVLQLVHSLDIGLDHPLGNP
jgi:hypothetical protein